LDTEEAAGLIRGHWSIENRLHWFLDVCFGEDDCRARTNHAAENLNVLRKTTLYLLRKTSVPEKQFGISHKMLRATHSDDFPHDVLFGKAKMTLLRRKPEEYQKIHKGKQLGLFPYQNKA
jgi:hypothetical protein